jgi:hypothetical protein
MEQLLLACKKTFSFLLIFVVSFSLVFGVTTPVSFAQNQTPPPTQTQTGVQVQPSGTSANVTAPAATGTQASTNATGITGENQTQKTSEEVTASLVGCAASIVAGVVSQATVALFKKISPDTFRDVSVRTTADTTQAGSAMGGPPSVNSIAYCIINAVIEYLTTATINWINSGFDGNPAFVENPEQFFKDVGDIEAAIFLQQVVQKTTGLNICEPFRLNIVTGLAGSRGDQFANQSKCTLDDISGAIGESGVKFDYQEYTSGRSANAGNLDFWRHATQNDQNNFMGAYFMSQEELAKRVSVKENTAQLDLTMGSGFLSFKKCSEDEVVTNPDGTTKTVKGACGVTTPGRVIEQQLNNRLNTGNERLIVADKFDQIITALVNQLIKVALNEVLEGTEDSAAGE